MWNCSCKHGCSEVGFHRPQAGGGSAPQCAAFRAAAANTAVPGLVQPGPVRCVLGQKVTDARGGRGAPAAVAILQHTWGELRPQVPVEIYKAARERLGRQGMPIPLEQQCPQTQNSKTKTKQHQGLRVGNCSGGGAFYCSGSFCGTHIWSITHCKALVSFCRLHIFAMAFSLYV